MTRYEERRDKMLSDPSVRFALKNAIREFDKKDPNDAVKDALDLVALQELRVTI